MKDIKMFFSLTVSERRGAVVLLLVLAGLLLVRNYLTSEDVSAFDQSHFSGFERYVTALSIADSLNSINTEPQAYLPESIAPNDMSTDEWMALGFTESQARSILKFKEMKGGFYRPEDLMESYFIDSTHIQKWESRLIWDERIAQEETEKETEKGDGRIQIAEEDKTRPVAWKEYPKPSIIEINTADSADFELLPGIGPGTAGRIVKYRDLLGGFYKKEQLQEVWGFRPENYEKAAEYLDVEAEKINYLCLNGITEEELKDHPYLAPSEARVIIAWREQHGAYQNCSDILKTIVIKDSVYVRIKPYLRICN